MDYRLLTLGFVVGATAGAFSLLGLWLTVRRLAVTQHPNAMLATSAAVRMLAVLLGFYFLAHFGPLALFGGLGGFLAVRTLAISRSRAGRPAAILSERMDSR